MDEGLPIETTEPSKRAVKFGRITLCFVGLICLLVAGSFSYLNPHRQVLLASCVFGAGILLVWLGLALILNVGMLALPQTLYPLQRYKAEVRALLQPNDLVIAFADYGGGAHYEFINPHVAPLIMPDRLFMQNGSVDAVFDLMEREIARTLAGGGKVYVFDILDPDNWHGPWDQIAGRGLTKKRMFAFFAERYRAEALGNIAEIPAWRLTAK